MMHYHNKHAGRWFNFEWCCVLVTASKYQNRSVPSIKVKILKKTRIAYCIVKHFRTVL